jgi:uncharacterized protein YggT (Ycf19 family)
MKRYLPLEFGGVDLSPIALLLALSIIEKLILNIIFQLSGGF